MDESLTPHVTPRATQYVTPRLTLRRMTPDDAAFVHALLNDPAWLEYIGDRDVRSEAAARAYIESNYLPHYARHGFGLYVVVLRETNCAIGMCGLIKRDHLADVDVGFAMLPAFRGKGYAAEAARATLVDAREVHALRRVVAIATPDNHASIALLERIGLVFEQNVRWPPDNEDLALYAIQL